MLMGVVADDITGSNDIGIMFAKSGCRVHVYPYEGRPLEPGQLHGPEIVILDTNTRLDPPQAAYDKVFAATRELQDSGCRQFFNKTCSVFRGNIGVEFDAMLDALGTEFAVVVLGFPKNGRTTVDGIHYVRGVPLEESEFRSDPIHPMTRSDLVGILGAQTRRKVGLIDHRTVARGALALRERIARERESGALNYLILDVTSQEDLRIIAEAVSAERVLCGSSALAEELPAVWGASREEKERLDLPSQDGLGILCAAGSLMPQTAAQVQCLKQAGVRAFELETLRLFDPGERQGEIERQVESIVKALQQGQDVLFHTPLEAGRVEQMRAEGERRGLSKTDVSRRVSSAVAEVVALAVEEAGLNRLVVAGGETSAAVCARLGVSGLRIWKEIQPGLPSCLSIRGRPLLLVLKSGSFGTAGFLVEAVDHVKRE